MSELEPNQQLELPKIISIGAKVGGVALISEAVLVMGIEIVQDSLNTTQALKSGLGALLGAGALFASRLIDKAYGWTRQQG